MLYLDPKIKNLKIYQHQLTMQLIQFLLQQQRQPQLLQQKLSIRLMVSPEKI